MASSESEREQSLLDYELIRNTIATYCIALDTKDFKLLSTKVFTEDVEAVYPFFTIQGAEAVAARIEKRLRPITSQHALTTQTIQILDGRTAYAVTYFTGVHFGRIGSKWEGKDVTAWGKYEDELVYVEDSGLKGGRWLIRKRTTKFMARRGEEGVMEEEE